MADDYHVESSTKPKNGTVKTAGRSLEVTLHCPVGQIQAFTGLTSGLASAASIASYRLPGSAPMFSSFLL
jgi:hypothetical protein